MIIIIISLTVLTIVQNGASFISREDGSFDASEEATGAFGVPGRVTEIFGNSNVEVERGDTYTEIRVGGGIGVNVEHIYGELLFIAKDYCNVSQSWDYICMFNLYCFSICR